MKNNISLFISFKKLKFVIALLIVNTCFVSQAQLFAPYQEEINFLVDYIGKSESKSNIKEFKKKFYKSKVKKHKVFSHHFLKGYLSKEKKVFITLIGGSKIERFSLDVINKPIGNTFTQIDLSNTPKLTATIKQNGWLDSVIYYRTLNQIYGFLPSTNILVKITPHGIYFNTGSYDLKKYHEIKQKVNTQKLAQAEVIKRIKERKEEKDSLAKIRKEICAKITQYVPNIDLHEAPTITSKGFCIENCDELNKNQTWHYGNAIYIGKVKNGVPDNNAARWSYATKLYLFDKKYCKLSINEIPEYKLYYTSFSGGKAVGKSLNASKALGESKSNTNGTLFYENGKTVRFDGYYLNENWDPTSTHKARYKCYGKIENGSLNDNNVKVYDLELNQLYVLSFKNGKPASNPNVNIYLSENGKYKLSSKKAKNPEFEDLFYRGKVDDNWNPKGKGTRYYRSKKYPKIHQWSINSVWENKDTIVPNSAIVMNHLTEGTSFQGIADYLRIKDERGVYVKGEFRVFKRGNYSSFWRGEFMSYELHASPYYNVFYISPQGTHVKYEKQNDVYKIVKENHYEKGYPSYKPDAYTYPGLKMRIKAVDADINAQKALEERARERRAAAAKRNSGPTTTCPACAGSGKQYVSNTQRVTTSKFSEDDANYYKHTKTEDVEYLKIVKCGRCSGTGKVKK